MATMVSIAGALGTCTSGCCYVGRFVAMLNIGEHAGTHYLQADKRPSPAASPLSPQKNQGGHDAKSTSPGMDSAPPFDHEARFSRGSLHRRVHEMPVDRRDHEDCVGPICEQDDSSEYPAPVAGAQIGNEPQQPPTIARLAYIM